MAGSLYIVKSVARPEEDSALMQYGPTSTAHSGKRICSWRKQIFEQSFAEAKVKI